ILSGLAIGIGAGTGTAWLAELIGSEDKTRATVIATGANFLGLGIGALTAGILAEYLPSPLRLAFIVYLLTLVAVSALVWSTLETVSRPASDIVQISMRTRLSVPSELYAMFVVLGHDGTRAMHR